MSVTFIPDPAIPLNIQFGIPIQLNFNVTEGFEIVSASTLPSGLLFIPGNPAVVTGVADNLSDTTIVLNATNGIINTFAQYTINYKQVPGSFICTGNRVITPSNNLVVVFPCAPADSIVGRALGGFILNIFGPPGEGPDFNRFFFNASTVISITFLEVNQNTFVVDSSSGVTQQPAVPGYQFTFKLNAYDIYLDFNISNLDRPPTTSVFSVRIRGNVNISGNNNDDVIDGPNGTTQPVDVCDLTNIPRIIITSILADADNNTVYNFSVYDTRQYHGVQCRSELVCPLNCIYRTDFVKFPQIQTVLKGNLCKCNKFNNTGTLNQKIMFLMNKFNIDVEFDQFYGNITFYAALRYILSGLLYGKFSVKFLLGKYYKDFLRDLANSRFDKFLMLFTAPIASTPPVDFRDYFKFFLYDFDCENNNHFCHYGNVDNCRIKIHEREL